MKPKPQKEHLKGIPKPVFPPQTDMPEVKDGTVKEIKHEQLSWWDKRKLKKKPEDSYVVTMKFSNGTQRTFVVVSKGETFSFKKKMYHLDTKEAYFDLSMNQYHLTYSDDCSSPVLRDIAFDGDERWFKVMPENLKSLLKLEMLSVLIRSVEFNKYLKMIMVFVMANLLFALINIYFGYRMFRGH